MCLLWPRVCKWNGQQITGPPGHPGTSLFGARLCRKHSHGFSSPSSLIWNLEFFFWLTMRMQACTRGVCVLWCATRPIRLFNWLHILPGGIESCEQRGNQQRRGVVCHCLVEGVGLDPGGIFRAVDPPPVDRKDTEGGIWSYLVRVVQSISSATAQHVC